jgi:large subunit ribosomal protein L2
MGKRIIPRRRGRGTSTYRSPSHRHKGVPRYPKGVKGQGVVKDIFHAPGRSTPMASVSYEDRSALMLAPEGLRVNQTVQLGPGSPVELGNTLPLEEIPEGTLIHNIESTPGDGGKFVRTAGTSASIVTRGKKVIVQMPSGSFKNFDGKCLATIGILSNSGRNEKPFAKAGKKYHAYRSKAKRPKKVKGIAMNAANHPHGGGGHPHVGTQSSPSYNAPPGRKVGRLAPKPKKLKRRTE